MNPRILVIGVLIILCLTTLAGVFVQSRELGSLRADQQRQLASATRVRNQSLPTAGEAQSEESSASHSDPSPTLLELLQLRSQVGQLLNQKRELTSARAENERLHAQLATRSTNSPAGTTLPAGYIRRSQAQWAGMNTPENTMQSLLWAVQNRDPTNFLKLFTPESRQKLLREAGDAPDKVFGEMSTIPGLRVVSQQPLPDGSVELQVEIMPGQPLPGGIHFRQMGGEWKMDIF
jgi:hypothetical protein